MKGRILFLHDNFPGQYKHLAPYLYRSGDYDIRVATDAKNQQEIRFPAVRYAVGGAKRELPPVLRRAQRIVSSGRAAANALLALKREGWSPDVICAHGGWGSSLILKDLWPDARLLAFCEWFYSVPSPEARFLGRPPPTLDDAIRLAVMNVPVVTDLARMDAGVSPTGFQRSQFPKRFQPEIALIHDGVDVAGLRPDPEVRFLLNGKAYSRDIPVVTYVARGMEEYRGFPQFMAALAKLQSGHRTVEAIVVGEDRVAYGAKRKDGQTWKQYCLDTLDLDLDRINFPGLVPYAAFKRILQVSAAHVYLTVPFVLSWSLLEAMACAAPVIASRTAPVLEVIEDGVSGTLVDFFDVEALAETMYSYVTDPGAVDPLRKKARHIIEAGYSLEEKLAKHQALIDRLLLG